MWTWVTLTKDQDKKELPSPLKENMIERDWTPWEKPKGGRIEGGSSGCGEWGTVVAGKWRQLYLNNNKKREIGPAGRPVH